MLGNGRIRKGHVLGKHKGHVLGYSRFTRKVLTSVTYAAPASEMVFLEVKFHLDALKAAALRGEVFLTEVPAPVRTQMRQILPMLVGVVSLDHVPPNWLEMALRAIPMIHPYRGPNWQHVLTSIFATRTNLPLEPARALDEILSRLLASSPDANARFFDQQYRDNAYNVVSFLIDRKLGRWRITGLKRGTTEMERPSKKLLSAYGAAKKFAAAFGLTMPRDESDAKRHG